MENTKYFVLVLIYTIIYYLEVSIPEIKKTLFNKDVEERLKQFEWYAPIIITNAPNFIEKADLFNNCDYFPTFHIGIDSAQRLIRDYSKSNIDIETVCAYFRVYDRVYNGSFIYHKLNPKWPINFKLGIIFNRKYAHI